MAETTKIEWCDSTLNIQMGCDGCELWNPTAGVKHCYAGTLTERYGGKTGWPASFEQPKLFTERLKAALRWSDLRGKERPDKPWLNGRPRMVFLNDMGDTFTESLPREWLAPLLPAMADSPHVFMLLTKRGRRMREFSEKHALPPNVWPGVSVTTAKTLPRVEELLDVQGGGVRWVSAEPLLDAIDFHSIEVPRSYGSFLFDALAGNGRTHRGEPFPSHLDGKRIGLMIIGGESGPGARPCNSAWVRSIIGQCYAARVACFVKQLGSHPIDESTRDFQANPVPGVHIGIKSLTSTLEYHLRDRKGGDMAEWAEDLRVRQFPEVSP